MSRSIQKLASTTHTRPAGRRRQLTDFLFCLGEREAAQLTHGASFPDPLCSPLSSPPPALPFHPSFREDKRCQRGWTPTTTTTKKNPTKRTLIPLCRPSKPAEDEEEKSSSLLALYIGLTHSEGVRARDGGRETEREGGRQGERASERGRRRKRVSVAKREETGDRRGKCCEDTKTQMPFCVKVCNLAENVGAGVCHRINRVVSAFKKNISIAAELRFQACMKKKIYSRRKRRPSRPSAWVHVEGGRVVQAPPLIAPIMVAEWRKAAVHQPPRVPYQNSYNIQSLQCKK